MKRRRINPKTIIKIAIIVIAVIVAAIVFSAIKSHNEQKVEDKNVDRLQEMEAESPADIQKEIDKIVAKEATDIDPAKADWRKIFQGSVIVGDSITEALDEYDLLDTDVAIYKRGISIESKSNVAKRAIAMKPSKVFLSFGLNDLENYGSNADAFIAAYTKLVKRFQKALPDARIFINSVLPATKAKIKRVPDLQYSGKYNEKLKVMCDEMGLTFIDHTSIATKDLYEPDGQHFILAFYPKWLSNMAKAAAE